MANVQLALPSRARSPGQGRSSGPLACATVPCKTLLPVVRQLVLLTILTVMLAACGSSDVTTTPRPQPPDLTQLLASLASPDPVIQETGLAPALRTDLVSPSSLLPIGSTLAVSPETWDVVSRDRGGQPYLAKIQAELTRPGKPIEVVSLHLIHLDGQWLLYETSTL
jgi:hypothetical protein